MTQGRSPCSVNPNGVWRAKLVRKNSNWLQSLTLFFIAAIDTDTGSVENHPLIERRDIVVRPRADGGILSVRIGPSIINKSICAGQISLGDSS